MSADSPFKRGSHCEMLHKEAYAAFAWQAFRKTRWPCLKSSSGCVAG